MKGTESTIYKKREEETTISYFSFTIAETAWRGEKSRPYSKSQIGHQPQDPGHLISSDWRQDLQATKSPERKCSSSNNGRTINPKITWVSNLLICKWTTRCYHWYLRQNSDLTLKTGYKECSREHTNKLIERNPVTNHFIQISAYSSTTWQIRFWRANNNSRPSAPINDKCHIRGPWPWEVICGQKYRTKTNWTANQPPAVSLNGGEHAIARCRPDVKQESNSLFMSSMEQKVKRRTCTTVAHHPFGKLSTSWHSSKLGH